MKEFSLYDFLGLLLPGVVFLFLINTISQLFGIKIDFIKDVNETNIMLELSYSIIFGAVLYASSYYLNKKKLYTVIFGMYKKIGHIYLELTSLHNLLNDAFNQKSKEWYNETIFFNQEEFNKKEKSQQEDIIRLQGKFYSRMYNLMDYLEINKFSKPFQSYYYFFRQIVLALLICILLIALLYTLSFVSVFAIATPPLYNIISLIIPLLFLLIISTKLAQWYRVRMVIKMYLVFFNYLESETKNGGQNNG